MQLSSDVLNAQAGQRHGRPAPLSDLERDAVVYFFVRLKLIEPNFYDQIMPDESTERAVKREFANQLRSFSKERIDKGFYELKRLIGSRHPDYKYLSVPKIIGLMANGGSPECAPAGIYKLHQRAALPDKTQVQKSRAAGEAVMPGLLGMFED